MRKPNIKKLIRDMLTRGWMRDGAQYRYALTEECGGKSHKVHLATGLRTFSTSEIRWVREYLDEHALEDWPILLLRLKAPDDARADIRDNEYLCIKAIEAYFSQES